MIASRVHRCPPAAAAPLDALKGLSTAKAALLAQALGLTTIAELAAYTIVQAAATIAAQTRA